MLLKQIGKFPDQAASLGGCHAAPWTFVKSIASCVHGLIDVFAIAFRNLSENFAGRRIVGRKGLPGGGVRPLAVDQHLSRLIDKLRNTRMNLRGNCDGHTSSLFK